MVKITNGRSLVALLIGCAFLYACLFRDHLSHAKIAEDLRNKGKYTEAIAEYEHHISARLAASGKAPGENPYFYKLMIGDVYMESGDLASAETNYIVAADHGVDKALVASKLRILADRMAKENKTEEAMEMLRKYRDYDQLMIDLEVDRLFKSTLTSKP